MPEIATRRRLVIALFTGLITAATTAAQTTFLATATTQPDRRLPVRTSKYNIGDLPGRYRDANKRIKLFAVKQPPAALYDGVGREIFRFSKPVMLNVGAFKEMVVDGGNSKPTDARAPGAKRWFAWAWQADGKLSGWVAVDDLVDPPKVAVVQERNPTPPAESDEPLVVNAARGLEQLRGLRHVSGDGNIPPGHGNKGDHYTSRNPGPLDYVYLLFAVPTVQRGGIAKDSIPDGGWFIPALDENGKQITEVLTMYRNDDVDQPVPITFLYGRGTNGRLYGWLARANVGER